ncbi:hypothetical protein P9112_002925 [Eukaryota sp. TZLM1-RC]
MSKRIQPPDPVYSYRYHIVKEGENLFVIDERPPDRNTRTELGKENPSKPQKRKLSKHPETGQLFFKIGKKHVPIEDILDEAIDETDERLFPRAKAHLLQ